MAEQVKAISLSGINHNTDKIGVQDGMCEDLVNIRYKDGSWRTTGEGTIINADNQIEYKQVFIHTNVYRHVLGVKNGKLYWFGNLNAKADDASVDKELFEFDALDSAVEITSVQGDLFVSQTGHLLTVIDHPDNISGEDGETDSFEYYLFKSGDSKYKHIIIDVNGKKTDRSLFPFGHFHINYTTESILEDDKEKSNFIENNYTTFDSGDSIWTWDYEKKSITLKTAQDIMVKVMGDMQKRNHFTRPFLVIIAIELYDNSYAFCTNPVLIHPFERYSRRNTKVLANYSGDDNEELMVYGEENSVRYIKTTSKNGNSNDKSPWASVASASNRLLGPVFTADTVTFGNGDRVFSFCVTGSDLYINIEDCEEILNENSDIFSSVCVFITPEVDEFDMSEYAYKKNDQYSEDKKDGNNNISYFNPKLRSIKDIEYDLIHSNFYLLKRYTKNTIHELIENKKVDLSSKEDDGVLFNIVNQTKLPSDVTTRNCYLPKCMTNYNGRLHLGNYKSVGFHGYPIDSFFLNNHLVRYNSNMHSGNVYSAHHHENTTVARPFNIEKGEYVYYKNTLINTTGYFEYLYGNGDDSHNKYYGYPYLWEPDRECSYLRKTTSLLKNDDMISNNCPIVVIKVFVENNMGQSTYVRYIKSFDTDTMELGGETNFLEDLDPLLSFPDSRAKKMDIYIVTGVRREIDIAEIRTKGKYIVKHKSFKLTAHPYLNLAYYIDNELKPIKLSSFEDADVNTVSE